MAPSFRHKGTKDKGTQRNQHLRLKGLTDCPVCALFLVISKSGNSEVLTFAAPSLFNVPCSIFIICFFTSSLSLSLCVFVARSFRHKGTKDKGTPRNQHLALFVALFLVISKSGNSEVLTFAAPSLFVVPCSIFIICFDLITF